MILAFLLIGIIFVVSGLKGTETELAKQLEGDLVGTDAKSGFIVWLAALSVIGAFGYIPALQKPSRYLLALILVVFVLTNGGIFSQLVGAIGNYRTAGPAAAVALPAVASAGSGAGGAAGSTSDGGISGSGVLGAVGGIASLASSAAKIFSFF